MSDFERSGMAYDEPSKRRTPGNWFADLGDRLARGFNSYDQPPIEEAEWEPYQEPDQPTAAVDAVPWEPARKRFPTVLHGYDRGAVDAEIVALEREIDDLRAQRLPTRKTLKHGRYKLSVGLTVAAKTARFSVGA